MKGQENYYHLLGISHSANNDEIKKAYRNLVRKYHPDRNNSKNAPLILSNLNTAYHVLSDPKKRRAYDLCYRGDYENILQTSYSSIQDIYIKVTDLRRHTVKLNKYRMDKEALYFSLAGLLSENNLKVVNLSTDQLKKNQLIDEVLDIAILLAYPRQKLIAEQLMKIHIDSSQVRRFIKGQAISEFFRKYAIVLATLVAVIFTLLMIKFLSI